MPESSPSSDTPGSARVRRAPKFGVFAALGAALGLVVAMMLTMVFNGTDEASPFTTTQYTLMQVFGFVSLWCVPAGMLLGMLVAVVLDRTVGARTRTVQIERESAEDE